MLTNVDSRGSRRFTDRLSQRSRAIRRSMPASARDPRRIRFISAVLITWLASPAVFALDWALVPDTCTVPEGAVAFACGDLGTYVFGEPLRPLACIADDSGQAGDDEVYPPPRMVSVVDLEPVQIELPWVLTLRAAEQRARDLEAIGFETKDGSVMASLPAALVVDWVDSHGAAVVSIVSQVAGDDSRVGFYALDAPELVAKLGGSISDAHLAANLCLISDSVAEGTAPPTVVNLSFGRYSTDVIHPDTCADTLACQVARIVEQLMGQGIRVTAAAGNHRELLFPARIEGVTSIGTFDLAYFATHEVAIPSWESPENVDVLLPGDGVCSGGDLAAGSSFASAAAAGYLASDVRNSGSLSAGPGVWAPVKGPDCYLMGSTIVPSSACASGLDAFIDQTLSGEPCTGTSPDGAGMGNGTLPIPTEDLRVVKVRLAQNAVNLPNVPGYDEWQADTHHPTPGGQVCIPCEGDDGGGGGQALRVGGPLASKVQIAPILGSDITLDLGSSAGLGDSFQILKVYLRVGAKLYRALADPLAAQELTAGNVDRLILQDALDLVLADEQPSIVVLEWVDLDGDGEINSRERFWNSSPVYLP